ncbi:pyruvate, phosphate dikinase [Candidatus Kaiserbacteria bacterium]|nr:pyruvate, phosphate dikinase [Candidatus Kaiserbacteria bacterium]
MSVKYTYPFGKGVFGTPGLTGDKIPEVLGNKGGRVAVMCNYNLPVPPGFTISTKVCDHYYAHDRTYPAELSAQVAEGLTVVEGLAGKQFGDPDHPLLVSVRSGARASMPGMMDTVLNVGLNDSTVDVIGRLTNDFRFAYDCYRRLIEMYGSVVLNVEGFQDILKNFKEKRGLTLDTDLTADNWREIVASYKYRVIDQTGKPFPQDPHEQLWGAIGAVFGSWMNPRAVTYRRIHTIPDSWGTAVTVQAMVFGNMGDDCATGVAFTRNPSTGAKEFYGEFLVNAQGEDVVAGIRTPLRFEDLKILMPKAYDELITTMTWLENHFRHMQDVEFTIERGKLYILQTRNGKRTAHAAIKIAVDLVSEGLISTKEEALMRIDATSLDQLFHAIIDPAYKGKPWIKGLPASPGAVHGHIFLNAEDVIKRASKTKKVILVREETCPEDIGGMHAAQGILTARGGMTSHAAVVARGMGKPCVAGASGLHVDYEGRKISVGQDVVDEDGEITIDGHSGNTYRGKIPTIEPTLPPEYHKLMTWVDGIRRLKVRANAETPADARKAREMGAEGIGLCRTEHMFFGDPNDPDNDRIVAIREMIMAESEAERRAALDKLLPMQRADFTELFEIMHGLPVTIRLLDPPLHEFLPKTDEEFAKLSQKIGKSVDAIRARARALHETNPMLGLRGVRLSIAFPEIVEMQARAIFEAAYEAKFSIYGADTIKSPLLEIMIPLVGFKTEFDITEKVIRNIADDIISAMYNKYGIQVNYAVGTMIELPRACAVAGKIAESAEFFSFGTNDLTQTALGISRDDAGTFLGTYVEKGIMLADPFVSIDVDGVGKLVQMAVADGRHTKPDLKIGVCGEHGGDPDSIKFFHGVGLDYVSCSPFRVPIARLAAAQAAISERNGRTK